MIKHLSACIPTFNTSGHSLTLRVIATCIWIPAFERYTQIVFCHPQPSWFVTSCGETVDHE